MKGRLALLSFTVLSLVLITSMAVGCGQQPFIEPTPIPTLVPATLPPVAPTESPSGGEVMPTEPAGGEPPDTTDLIQAGSQVFETSCAPCHNLTAETKVGPGLAGLYDRDQLPNGMPVSDENLGEWIRNGGGAMPGLPLTDEQLAQVIAFLKDATQ
jgi:mono/diheme cytochrome c family protein